MCGICGMLNFDKSHEAAPALIERMCQAIKHRGPDGEGTYFDGNLGFGHRRLSIIDLAGGFQPMSNEDESVWIIQNGEIYNYKELTELLKKKGHRFKSNSDTEAIIHLYEEYGEKCLDYLNGMFAFAIWDKKKKRLFAARDRLGIKPFYYYIDKRRFVFASEIKAIIQLGFIEKSPNYKAIGSYLKFEYSTDDQTFFRNIKKLLPANYLLLNDGAITMRRYWAMPSSPDDSLDEEGCAKKLVELLNNAIQLHLRSDVKIGAHLSGGVDSSSVAALASQNLPYSLPTFSGAFNEGSEYDERPFIRFMVDRYKTDHHEIVPEPRESIEAILHLVWIMDEPTVSSGIIAHYFLNKLISRHVKVVMGGQGGDELFGGYYRFLPPLLRESFFKRELNLSSIKNLMRYIGTEGPAKVLQKIKRRKGLCGFVAPEIIEEFDQERPAAPGSMHEMQKWEIEKYLPGLLQVEDRTSMAFSVESRVPLLDYRLVEFAVSMPFRIKMKNFELKYLLRKVAADFLPHQIIERKNKQGFLAPVPIWFRDGLFSFIWEILSSRRFKDRGVFEAEKVAVNVEKFRQGKINFAEEIWQILNVELWFRTFIDQSAAH